MAVEIRQVTAGETRQLRQQVLRPHQTLEELARNDDGDVDAVYFAALDGDDGDDVVGTASVRREPPPWAPVDARSSWRVRGMATAEQWRGRGVGSALLDAVVDHVRARGGGLVWCSARLPAVPFYERAGFRTRGDSWEEPAIGPHIAMELAVRT